MRRKVNSFIYAKGHSFAMAWAVAVILLFGTIAGSAQTNIYLFNGAETNITLSPGVYSIMAYGAQGGAYGGYNISSGGGGPAAQMEGHFNFATAVNLTLLAGGAGNNGYSGFGYSYDSAGGGGGGSFVVNGNAPLVVAGGGGGAGYYYTIGNANIGTNGNGGDGSYPYYGGAGGTGGSGGSYGASSAYYGGGGGGGGFSGDGLGYDSGGGGSSFLDGGAGGQGQGEFDSGGYGGGGGGGGAYPGSGNPGGGGGGGYSGGGGGGAGTAGYSGGGGGSYIDSSAVAVLSAVSNSPDGSPNGEIIITDLLPGDIIIQTQPLSQSVVGGQAGTVNVSAVSSDPLNYQWLFNGTNIAGATNATYTISDIQSNNDGAYSVVVSDAVTSVNSLNAVLTVIYPPPIIVSEPTNLTVVAGSIAMFSAVATNYYPMSFQWQFNGTNLTDGGQISGSTNSTLTISSVEDANAGPFQVIVYNDYGATTSSIASLTVLDPIQIVAQPTNQALLPGSNATFTVTATGTSPTGYQWYFDGAPLTDGGIVSGSMSATLTLTNIQSNNSGNYVVVITNAFSSSTSSNATLTVINLTPVIVSPPASQPVISGSNAVFSVYATNYFPLSYQWQFNGTNLTDGGQISGSLSSNLMISSAQAANAGPYQVIVSESYGAVTSSIASLAVYAPPQIVGQPSSEAVLSGANTNFTVTATGYQLNYQWYCNGLPLTNSGNISGTTNSTLNISNVQTNNDGVYWVWVTSLSSGEASSNATLTVYNPAQIVAQPANAGILLGSNVTFAASATGTAVGYQWFFNGTPLTDNGHVTGSATPTLSIANIEYGNGGDYQLLVTNLLSSAMSRLATLTPLTNLAPSIRYVNLSNSDPASPYLSWSTAATNIQTAINASLNGDQIVVTDGVYQVGWATSSDGVSNRVFVPYAIAIQSVNGSSATLINGSGIGRCVYLTNGAALAGFTLTNGYSSGSGGGFYCVSTNSYVSNCLFINNIANSFGGGAYRGNLNNCTLVGNLSKAYGGGAYGSVLMNCVLTGNSATNSLAAGGGGASCVFNNCYLDRNLSGQGGGAYSSTLNYCTVSNNTVIVSAPQGGGVNACAVQNSLIISNSAPTGSGGGACNSALTNCLIQGNRAADGGGVSILYPNSEGMSHCTIIGNWASIVGGGFAENEAQIAVLTNCVISGNRAGTGGGVYMGRLFNCLVVNNWATNSAGGVYGGQLNNCTVCQNAATNQIGGMYAGSAYNSIVYYNTAPQSSDVGGSYLAKNCCFGQGVTGQNGFFTNAPLFLNLVAGDFHLGSSSPCINSGTNAYVLTTTDLDGNSRIVGGSVDIGCYEYQSPVSNIPYVWLAQYGLPIVAGIDTSDLDGTAFNVYQDWIAGLNPTNPASVLAMLTPTTTNTVTGITVTWQSVSGISYFLQRSTNLLSQPPFSTIQNNITGQAGTTSYTDTSATNNVPYFYRVGVP